MKMNKDNFQSFAMAMTMIRTTANEKNGKFEISDSQIHRLKHACQLIDQVVRKIPTCDGMTFDVDEEHHGIIMSILTGYYEDYEIKDCLIKLIRITDHLAFESIDSKTVTTEFSFYNIWVD
jgi:hypothetical protein